MKTKRLCLTTSLLMFYMMSMTAFASGDTGNAVADIMNNERFQGAMSTISFVSGFIDHYMTMAITLVSFFIISSALLKNVCAGAYCANNKFWNKVAEAHEAAAGASLVSIVQGVKNVPNRSIGGQGGLASTILLFVPNIKAMTDFDDQDMEPKHYWMKAIPQMLACIIIGVFIYNGYYRDTASLVGSAGSEVVKRALTSVDPRKMIDDITLTTGTPSNIYDGDTTSIGKMDYTISMDIYKAMRAEWKVTSTENKTSLMRDSEKVASDLTMLESGKYFTTDAQSNKVWQLSGLSIKPVSAENNNVSATSYGDSTQFYGYNGMSTLDEFMGATDPNSTERNFTVFCSMPSGSVQGLAGESKLTWVRISGTLTQVDGDASKQSTNIIASGGTSNSMTVTVDVSAALGANVVTRTVGNTNEYYLAGTYLSDPNLLLSIANASLTKIQSALGDNYTVTNPVVSFSGNGLYNGDLQLDYVNGGWAPKSITGTSHTVEYKCNYSYSYNGEEEKNATATVKVNLTITQ